MPAAADANIAAFESTASFTLGLPLLYIERQRKSSRQQSLTPQHDRVSIHQDHAIPIVRFKSIVSSALEKQLPRDVGRSLNGRCLLSNTPGLFEEFER